MTIYTPTSTCQAGHTHVSAFAAQVCERHAAPLPDSVHAPHVCKSLHVHQTFSAARRCDLITKAV